MLEENVVRDAAGLEQVIWVVVKVGATYDDGRGVETNVA
jgi:hypothetical protein